MNEMIWYCTEDLHIYPNEEQARNAFNMWCEHFDEEPNEDIFRQCYKEISFLNYNKDTMDSVNGYYGA